MALDSAANMPKRLYEKGPEWVSDPKEVEARKTREWPKTWEVGKHVAPYKPGDVDLSGKKPSKPKPTKHYPGGID